MRKYLNSSIIFGVILIALVFLVGYSNFIANKQLARQIVAVGQAVQSQQQTLQSQQQSITDLDDIPANKSSLAMSTPGAVTVDVTPDQSAATLGNTDAKVTIVEFADFQCPFCEKFFTDSEHDLISKYVDSGQARLVFEDFPFLGQESEDSAEAAKCAQAQGQFWPYHDYLYTHQSPKGENSGGFSVVNLESFAKAVPGIDSSAFDACLKGHKEETAVQGELATGNDDGVSSTPTVFINGKETVGVYPTSTYEQLIDQALKDVK